MRGMQEEAKKENWKGSNALQFFVAFSFLCIQIQNVCLLLKLRVEGTLWPYINAKYSDHVAINLAYLIKITRCGKHLRDRIASRPILHTGRAANTVANPDQYPDALHHQSK